MSTRNRHNGGERGNTLVESAFVLLTFVAVLLGTADLARIMYVHNSVNERIRNAARKAAIYSYTPDQVKNLIAYGGLAAPEGADIVSLPGYEGILPSNISVEYFDAGTNDRRVRVVVTGMRIVTVSPWLRRVSSNIPISLTVPLETP